MFEVVWEDPPSTGGWWTAKFAEECRAHPGEWAKVLGPAGREEHAASTFAALKRRGLEMRTTILRDDGSQLKSGYRRIWARWPDSP